MEPNNRGLEDDFPFSIGWFLGFMLIFRGIFTPTFDSCSFRQMLLAFGASRNVTYSKHGACIFFSFDPNKVVQDVKRKDLWSAIPSLKMILLNLVTHGISTSPKKGSKHILSFRTPLYSAFSLYTYTVYTTLLFLDLFGLGILLKREFGKVWKAKPPGSLSLKEIWSKPGAYLICYRTELFGKDSPLLDPSKSKSTFLAALRCDHGVSRC